MKTSTAHKPYVKYETGKKVPVLGYTEGNVPLVPDGGGFIVKAYELGEDFEIVVTNENIQKMLHG